MSYSLNVIKLLAIALMILGGESAIFPLWHSTYAASESRVHYKSEQDSASQLMDEGDQYYRTGYWRQAIDFYEQALAIYQASGDLAGEGEALNRLGNALNRLQEPEKALEFIQQALAIYQDLNDQRGIGETLTNLGAVYVRSRQLDQAQDTLEQALTIHQEIGNREGEAHTFRELAAVINLSSNPTSDEIQQALIYGQQSLELAQEIGDPEIQIRALLTKGYSIRETADSTDQYQESIGNAQQALNIARELKNLTLEERSLRFIARSNRSVALLEKSSEQHKKTIDYAKQAIVIAKELGNQLNEGTMLQLIARSNRSIALLESSPEQHQKAIDYAKQAIATAREVDNRFAEGSMLRLIAHSKSDLASQSRSPEHFQEVIDYAQQALTIARELDSQVDEGSMLRLIAWSYDSVASLNNSVEQYSQAIEYAQQAFDIALALENRANEEETLRIIALFTAKSASLRKSFDDYQTAIDYANRALTIAQELEDYPNEMLNLMVIAASYYELASLSNSPGQYQAAIDYAEQSILVAQELEKRFEEAAILQIIFQSRYNLATSSEDYQELINYIQQALVIVQETQNKNSEGTLLRLLAFASSQITTDFQEAYKNAFLYLEKSLLIAQESGNKQLEAMNLADMANVHHQAGNYRESLEFAQNGFEIAGEINNPLTLMYTSMPLLQIHDLLGSDQEAFEIIQKALENSKKLEIEEPKAIFLAFLGYLSWKLEDSENAIKLLEQATEISSRANYPELNLLSLLFSGVIYGGIGEEEKALDFLQEVLVQSENNVSVNEVLRSTIFSLKASLNARLENIEEAIDSYNQALSLIENNELANPFSIYAGLARIYRDQNLPNTAITYYKLAVNDVEQFRLKLSGLPSDAQDTFLASIIDFDRSSPADIYRELADLLLSQGRILEAQQVLEILKGQELSDFKTGQTRATWNGENLIYNDTEQKVIDAHGSLIALGQKIYTCEQEDCTELDSLYQDRTLLESTYDQKVSEFEDSIRTNREEDLDFFDPDSLSDSAADIVEAEPNTVLIYPLVLEDKLWLLWTTAGGVSGTVEVPVTRQELGEAAINFRRLIQRPDNLNLPALQSTAQKLYGWLIEPLSESLEENNIENLVFAHDRTTRYIPMAALHDGEQYLIQRYRISSILSAELTDTEERFAAINNPNILGLGLSEAVGDLSELPSVPVELDAIVQSDNVDVQGIYPGTTYLNKEFDQTTLWTNARKNQILHIATHAEFVPGLPEESYLVLGNGEPLTIDDIESNGRQLRNVHMVVLSACETALGGPAADGAEIAGISSYFLEKGRAKTVLASLWQVNDDSTSLLMQQFYENLANDDLTKAEALRQAQLSLLQVNEPVNDADRGFIEVIDTRTGEAIQPSGDLAHPYYWAPFTLIGNSL